MTVTRRDAVVGGAVVGATAFASRAFAGWQPNEMYPDPAVQVLDPSFNKYRLFNASVERLATGMRWCEGPVWIGDARCLLWSDIPSNAIMRWDEETGQTSVFRKPSNNANGNTRDRQGRLITCEHGGRRVSRTEYDGTITTLIDRFEGKPLNSPNDVVVKSDDTIWFTDPPFGIGGHYEGNFATPELPFNVYRLDPKSGRATVVTGEFRDRTGSHSRRTRRSSTSSPRVTRPIERSACSTSERTGSYPTAASSSMQARAARRTVFASIQTGISGAAGAWAATKMA
jgi:gluconolactonase